MVNIGKITVPLEKKDQIGDETFKVGQDIKVCVIDVESSPKGAIIRISRSDPLFLRRLFEQEIREIFDGTVIIKNIARNAGVRSKVAVYSNDPNVDACGACIGVNGTRIQNISQNLGNGREKEKIDIVLYDPCIELYIIESLVPGHVIGLQLDTVIDNNGNEVPHALAITKNGEVSTTVGTRGVNVFLAYKLTGYKIDVMQLDDALKQGLTFMGLEEIKARVELSRNPKPVTVAAAPEFVEIDEEYNEELEEIVENEIAEETPVEVAPVVEEVTPVETVVTPVVEEVKVEEKAAPEVEIASVDVVKMDDLLSKLEEEKAAAEKSNKPRKSFKKKEEKVEVVKEEKKQIQGMAIYTDEELEELRRQEELEDEEESYGVDIDDDYDEYDSDDYYED
jgi:N utilization substance protein A